MAADVSKRRDKEEKIDVSVLLALGGAKKVGAGCRTPVQPSLKEGTHAVQMGVERKWGHEVTFINLQMRQHSLRYLPSKTTVTHKGLGWMDSLAFL